MGFKPAFFFNYGQKRDRKEACTDQSNPVLRSELKTFHLCTYTETSTFQHVDISAQKFHPKFLFAKLIACNIEIKLFVSHFSV